jgi:hypothetical protein
MASSRRKTRLAVESDRISDFQGFDGDGHGMHSGSFDPRYAKVAGGSGEKTE